MDAARRRLSPNPNKEFEIEGKAGKKRAGRGTVMEKIFPDFTKKYQPPEYIPAEILDRH